MKNHNENIAEKLEENKTWLIEFLADKLGLDETDVTMESNLRNDLGVDDLDDVEIIMEIEKKYDVRISDEDSCENKTVEDVYNMINNYSIDSCDLLRYRQSLGRSKRDNTNTKTTSVFDIFPNNETSKD